MMLKSRMNFDCEQCFNNEICKFRFKTKHAKKFTTDKMVTWLPFEYNDDTNKVECRFYTKEVL